MIIIMEYCEGSIIRNLFYIYFILEGDLDYHIKLHREKNE
jgi:hypothetical protein